jgi:uncharacterized protein
LKINVSKIPEEGMVISFERQGGWFLENLAGAPPPDYLPGRIDVACKAWRMKENVFIEGTVATAVDMPCSRCLEMTHLPLRSSFKYTFVPPPAQSQEEMELSAEDLDFAYYEGDIINLDEVIVEQIMLQVPIKPLCEESCRGLCPHCGVNRNKTGCECRDEVFDERLAVLKKFKEKP